LPNTATAGAPAITFDRLQTQATQSIGRNTRRLREIAERFRALYREQLEEWVRMRGRLDNQLSGSTEAGSAAAERLRTRHDNLGRELAATQARLKRMEVAARQLELVASYLANPDPNVDEPILTDVESPAAVALRIIQAQEGERQRLAEEIHDGPAQVLTNAIFQVEYLDRVIDDAPRTAHDELAFLRTMLRDGLDEVRGFIAELRPPAVDVGLAKAIADQAGTFADRHGLVVEVDVEGIDDSLTPDEKASVLRILQEALQNVRKHSAASRVRICIEGGNFVIGDNGRGFDVMRLASGASHNFGLQFMRERAELMGTPLQIESRQGEGTRILLRLPEH
jgi:two-component system, NarL family, sensor histidine kinase DegS